MNHISIQESISKIYKKNLVKNSRKLLIKFYQIPNYHHHHHRQASLLRVNI